MDTPIRQTEEPRHRGYSPGHSWYYKEGGKPLYPKQIRDDVIASGYRGYDEADITAMAQRTEPKRSNSLRRHRKQIIERLSEDLSRYREVVRELHAHRRAPKAPDRLRNHRDNAGCLLRFCATSRTCGSRFADI